MPETPQLEILSPQDWARVCADRLTAALGEALATDGAAFLAGSGG